ncbi:MAG: 5'-deoxynucleotidase [Trueperaceae bacterium]|nr:MAG: 5'-deoxynucleotidase [Trueperaceae bacterium]
MSHFFAYLARMKFIQRWGLMRNTRTENIQEHSLQVAMVAHALAVMSNARFGASVDPERTALLAVFHDAEEVITGDLPTPIKYFNPRVKEAIDSIESVAKQRLTDMLPDDLRSAYEPLLFERDGDAAHWRLVKLADKLCAYLKCLEEAKAGNREFERAEATIRASLEALDEPVVEAFIDTFVPSFRLTLDELN